MQENIFAKIFFLSMRDKMPKSRNCVKIYNKIHDNVMNLENLIFFTICPTDKLWKLFVLYLVS